MQVTYIQLIRQIYGKVNNVNNFLSAYGQWKKLYSRTGENKNLTLSLRYVKGLSAEFTKARGQAEIDLDDGKVFVKVSGLSNTDTFGVWIVDNQYTFKDSIKPEVDDNIIYLGQLRFEDNFSTLQSQLTLQRMKNFEIDLIVIARARGEKVLKNGLLFGSPNIFQKLYYSEQAGQLALFKNTNDLPKSISKDIDLISSAYNFLVPSLAFAWEETSSLQKLIDDGERIFFTETFNGNGRTCGTCHPAVNNFTLDPEFIANLPNNDPLFVAEFNPALAELEKPELMRKFAIILENLDGFEDPTHKFVMRSIPHLLALSTSILADPSTPGQFPVQMTGWSSDGAPGTGSLREFAIGAVIQHFPKSLSRNDSVDLLRF